ncbi:hypothetical protein M2366_003383, partial [Aeromonas sp. BIGb0405]|nr:hypothetical protein [Aeromonas sp. BIGb0405]
MGMAATRLENTQKQKGLPDWEGLLYLLAERTGLEPATPGVTGR